MRWKDYWNTFPKQFKNNEFFKQVAKTVSGQPISEEHFQGIISDIVEKLELSSDDFVLDLCCGNGLITSKIAERCRAIIGVDYSKPLIKVAQEHHTRVNTRYINLSVLDISADNLFVSQPFSKIFMYEALQYFEEEQFPVLLKKLLTLSAEDIIILFASVPDRSKIWEFYNTPERKRDYYVRSQSGTEAIGTWWSKSLIYRICDDYDLECEYLPQQKQFHTSHYRFDVRIRRQ